MQILPEEGPAAFGPENDTRVISVDELVSVATGTSALPIISSLNFGCAVGAILFVDWVPGPDVVKFLLAVSAALSLFSTTFALLEVYYIHMVVGRSTRQNNSAAQNARFSALSMTVRKFTPLRTAARHALWFGVVSLIIACAILVWSIGGIWNKLSGVALVVGSAAVPITVWLFRSEYRLLLADSEVVVEVVEPRSNWQQTRSNWRRSLAFGLDESSLGL